MSTLLKHGSRGQAVRRLQRLLNTNKYHKARPQLAVDGEFGPRTGAAVADCKRFIGYEVGEWLPIAGPRFLGYLDGSVALTAAMRARRRWRLAKALAAWRMRHLRTKALAAARADVGLLEGPNNAIKYNAWWLGRPGTDGGAYCVRAGSYWYAKAGSKAVERLRRWENTDSMLADAQAHRNGLRLVSKPAPGDGFVIDFDGHADPDHFGLFVRDLGGGVFRSVEANATLPNGRQGVGYHERAWRNCWFIRFER